MKMSKKTAVRRRATRMAVGAEQRFWRSRCWRVTCGLLFRTPHKDACNANSNYASKVVSPMPAAAQPNLGATRVDALPPVIATS